jgi:hypothetical protein
VLSFEDIETNKKREEAEKNIQGLSSDQLNDTPRLIDELAGKGNS